MNKLDARRFSPSGLKIMKQLHRVIALCAVVSAAAAAEASTQFSAVDYSLYPGDFNGDGLTDLLYIGKTPDKPNGLALADANGAPQLGFQSWPATYLGIPWSTGQFIPAIGDFNGDGKSDVLMQSATAGTSYLLLANGNSQLAPVGQLVGIHQGIGQTAFGIEWSADKHKLHVGDFDGSGEDDVLLQATNKGGTNAIILTDGNGGLFTASTSNCWGGGPQQCWTDGEQGFLWSTQSSVLHVGKFNADARSDLLVQGRPDFVLIPFDDLSIPIPIFRPQSFGIFLAQVPDAYGKIIRLPNQTWNHTDLGGNWSPLNTRLIVGDFDGDGYADILIQQQSNALNMLANGSANGTIGTATALTNGAGAWNSTAYNVIVGRFGSQVGLYLQATGASGTNYYTGNITGGSVSYYASALQTAAVLPAPTTSVGSTPASADVTPNGAASYSIPIQLPKGTAGLTPSLSLTYSSSSGNGLVGVGWNLAGLGIIARCPQTLAQDGVTQDVQLLTTDQYCLDGNRLRLVLGTQGASGSVYRTELETFARITANGVGTQGPQWFQVETKDGLVYEYGNSADSRISVPGTSVTRVWALSKVRDRDFNNWTVTYVNDTANGSYRPDRIDYAANSAQGTAAPYRVRFYYEGRNAGEQVVNYYQGGLVNQTQRLLRIELQSSGGAARIRAYKLLYQSGSSFNAVSRLASLQECGPTDSVCMAATTFTWSDQASSGNTPSFSLPWRFNPYTTHFPTVQRQTPDLNGDGIQDLFVRWDGSIGAGGYSYQLGVRNGETVSPSVDLPFQSDPTWYEGVYNTTIDWDADGKDDIITRRGETLWWLHGKADGSIAYEVLPAAYAETAISTLQIDIDGDGFRDAVYVNWGTNTTPGTNGSITVRFHRRDAVQGFEPTTYTLWTPAAGSKIVSTYISFQWAQYLNRTLHTAADINGDGRQDVVVQVNNGWRVLYSTGTSFTEGELLSTTYFASQASYATPVAIDMNGDGCTDLAYPTSSGWKLATSKCRVSSGIGLYTAVTVTSITSTGYMTSVTDANLDGYQDLVVGHGSGLGTSVLYLSTGTSFAAGATLPTVAIAPVTSVMDINGDGIPDGTVECGPGWQYGEGANCDEGISELGAVSGIGPKPNLLLTATDGFGKQTQFSYSPLTDPAVYTRGSSGIGKSQDIQGASYVVRQLVMSDGAGGTYSQQYTYQGAKRHIAGRGFLGFAGRTITDSRTGFVTQETYNNTVADDGTGWELVGTLAQAVVRQYAGGPIVSELTQQWSSLAPDGVNNRRYPYVPQAVTKKYELSGPNTPYVTSTTTTTIDNYGTPYDVTTVTVEGITGLNSGSSHTQRVYTPLANIFTDTTNWCISRPSRIEDIRSHTLTDGGQITRVTEQTWNGPKCRVTNTLVAPGTSWALNTAIEYDFFNNVNRTTVTSPAVPTTIPTPIVTEANYGANGHLKQWEENALDHRTTFTWNVNCGQLQTKTEPNITVVTSWTYDDFCREQRMTRPDGTSTYKTYHLCDANNGYCGDSLLRYSVRTSDRNTSDVEINHVDQFFDVMGRVKYEQKVGFGGQTIGVQTLYDNRGNVAMKSNPFYVGAGSVSGVSHEYDLLNRLVRTQRPISDADRTVVNEWLTYNGLTTTAIDALGGTQSKVASAWGTVTRATDEAVKHAAYTYNAFGDLRTVTDPAGNATAMTYNIRGFKATQNDPDMGNWSYTYDALGQTLSQLDAKSQTTTFTYDVLGRNKTREDHPGGSANRTTWTWDTATNGKGLLASVASPGSYSETHTYDNRSRPLTFSTVANGTTFVMEYAYNSTTGRLELTTYPNSTGTRLAVQHNYNQYGFLKDLRDTAVPTPPLWQANAHDPLGHVTQEQFANGHITNLGFDQTNGRLYSVQTGLSGGALIQNLSYHWDAQGNLLRRSDNLQSVTEAFTYDANYRLSTVTRNGTQTLTMGYNDIGNVTSKSDGAGAYVYSGAQAGCTYYGHSQPHAVRKVGTNVYCYDANGNMVSRSGSSVTWSTFNYPTTINQAGGNTSTFYYGANRNAYRQVSVDAGVTEDRVTISDGAFERLIRGSQTEYRHFVSANGRVVAIVKRSAQTGNKKFYPHADHLGSTDVTTDETGAVFLRTSFDAWGQRRGGTWSGPPTAPEKTAINASTHRGYTGHEQLDNLSLVHMKGRVYDPVIARFMSADPIIQSPFRSQSFNRYSYVWNNPLNSTDPTGFCRKFGRLDDFYCQTDLSSYRSGDVQQNGSARNGSDGRASRAIEPPRNSAQGGQSELDRLRRQADPYRYYNIARPEDAARRKRFSQGVSDQLRENNHLFDIPLPGGGAVPITKTDVLFLPVGGVQGGAKVGGGFLRAMFRKAFGAAADHVPVPASVADNVVNAEAAAADNTVDVFRVVDDVELADIMRTGEFRTVPGQFEGKQFLDNLADATRLRQRFSEFFGGNQTIVRGTAPRSVIDNASRTPFSDIPNGSAITVPSGDLPAIRALCTVEC
jgi:RHS repeat-associated protein